jgi:hypothetical protein
MIRYAHSSPLTVFDEVQAVRHWAQEYLTEPEPIVVGGKLPRKLSRRPLSSLPTLKFVDDDQMRFATAY